MASLFTRADLQPDDASMIQTAFLCGGGRINLLSVTSHLNIVQVFFLSISSFLFGLKFYIPALLGDLADFARDPSSLFCFMQAFVAQFFGTATISWSGCIIWNAWLAVWDSFTPRTASMMNKYHGFVWSLSTATTGVAWGLNQFGESSDGTCWIRGNENPWRLLFQLPLLLYMLAAVTLFLYVMSKREMAYPEPVPRMLAYVIVFVMAWLWPLVLLFWQLLGPEGNLPLPIMIAEAFLVSAQGFGTFCVWQSSRVFDPHKAWLKDLVLCRQRTSIKSKALAASLLREPSPAKPFFYHRGYAKAKPPMPRSVASSFTGPPAVAHNPAHHLVKPTATASAESNAAAAATGVSTGSSGSGSGSGSGGKAGAGAKVAPVPGRTSRHGSRASSRSGSGSGVGTGSSAGAREAVAVVDSSQQPQPTESCDIPGAQARGRRRSSRAKPVPKAVPQPAPRAEPLAHSFADGGDTGSLAHGPDHDTEGEGGRQAQMASIMPAMSMSGVPRSPISLPRERAHVSAARHQTQPARSRHMQTQSAAEHCAQAQAHAHAMAQALARADEDLGSELTPRTLSQDGDSALRRALQLPRLPLPATRLVGTYGSHSEADTDSDAGAGAAGAAYANLVQGSSMTGMVVVDERESENDRLCGPCTGSAPALDSPRGALRQGPGRYGRYMSTRRYPQDPYQDHDQELEYPQCEVRESDFLVTDSDCDGTRSPLYPDQYQQAHYQHAQYQHPLQQHQPQQQPQHPYAGAESGARMLRTARDAGAGAGVNGPSAGSYADTMCDPRTLDGSVGADPRLLYALRTEPQQAGYLDGPYAQAEAHARVHPHPRGHAPAGFQYPNYADDEDYMSLPQRRQRAYVPAGSSSAFGSGFGSASGSMSDAHTLSPSMDAAVRRQVRLQMQFANSALSMPHSLHSPQLGQHARRMAQQQPAQPHLALPLNLDLGMSLPAPHGAHGAGIYAPAHAHAGDDADDDNDEGGSPGDDGSMGFYSGAGLAPGSAASDTSAGSGSGYASIAVHDTSARA